MRKRSIITLVVGGLMAAMLPGVAAAQTMQALGTVTFIGYNTCESGQESPLALPACEMDEAGTTLYLTYENPGVWTGTFEGLQLFDGVMEYSLADDTFTFSGSTVFAGSVAGCGEAWFYFQGSGGGSIGSLVTYTSNDMVAVPGGGRPLVANLDLSGVQTNNSDGTHTLEYTGTYSCDAS